MHCTHRIDARPEGLRHVLLVISVGLLICGSVGHATERDGLADSARSAMLDIFRKRDPSAVERRFAPKLVQHDPAIADGIEGMRVFARGIASLPNSDITIYRTLVDGNFVLLHSRYSGLKGPSSMQVAFDLFRFQDGKIAEHWGGQEAEATTPNLSGRTQLDGPTAVVDRDKTEANRALVKAFKEIVTVQQRYDRVEEFIDDARYAQHALRMGDGIARLKARINSATGGSSRKAEPALNPRRYVADGNFVLALVRAAMPSGPTANYDLFRVESGKIVEHWDVISPIPEPEQRHNQNDPF